MCNNNELLKVRLFLMVLGFTILICCFELASFENGIFDFFWFVAWGKNGRENFIFLLSNSSTRYVPISMMSTLTVVTTAHSILHLQ